MEDAVATRAAPRLRLGVSACLVGERVRFDGGAARSAAVADALASRADLTIVCPEVEAGFGVPRPRLRLTGDPSSPRLCVEETGEDVTERVRLFFAARIATLDTTSLDGFILKSRSPSCGIGDTKLHATIDATAFERVGTGLFAAALAATDPALPLLDDARLEDPATSGRFFETVVARARLRMFLESVPLPRDLITFHTRHKFELRAHSEAGYQRLGRTVAEAGSADLSARLRDYAHFFRATMNVPPTRATMLNALEHGAGFVKDAPADLRHRLHATLEALDGSFGAWRTAIEALRVAALGLRGDETARAYVLSQTLLDPPFMPSH